jgi:hypothetical protein
MMRREVTVVFLASDESSFMTRTRGKPVKPSSSNCVPVVRSGNKCAASPVATGPGWPPRSRPRRRHLEKGRGGACVSAYAHIYCEP